MKTKLALLAVPMVAAMWAVSVPVAADQATFINNPVPGEHENTRNLFRLRCGGCHGVNGEGAAHLMPKLAPALKGNPFILNAPPAVIINVIRKGRTGRARLYHDQFPNMPAFGVEFVPNVDELVQFLKTDLQK